MQSPETKRGAGASPITSLNIDMLRSILAHWVIIAHVSSVLFPIPLIPGRLAVWGFFVASGYLNAISFERRALNLEWRHAVLGYYRSRIERIYPMLIFSYLDHPVVQGV